jgi:hypothetical protein
MERKERKKGRNEATEEERRENCLFLQSEGTRGRSVRRHMGTRLVAGSILELTPTLRSPGFLPTEQLTGHTRVIRFLARRTTGC